MTGAAEHMSPICWSETKEQLVAFVNSQLAPEPYQDVSDHWQHGSNYTWGKVFRKGSVLEWFNALTEDDYFGSNYEYNLEAIADDE